MSSTTLHSLQLGLAPGLAKARSMMLRSLLSLGLVGITRVVRAFLFSLWMEEPALYSGSPESNRVWF